MRKIAGISIIIVILFSNCNKCGENVYLGDFELLEQSITSWFPYDNTDTLFFRNINGDFLNLVVSKRKTEMLPQTFRQICKGTKLGDIAYETYRTESRLVDYIGINNDDTYFITVNLTVERYVVPTNTNTFKVYDKILFDSNFQRYGGSSNQNLNGDIALIASKRGETNTIENEALWFGDEKIFAQEISINGKTFHNVWYDDTEEGPVIYIQEGVGVIAFLGFDDQIWMKR